MDAAHAQRITTERGAGRIFGRVLTADGAPLQGVTVKLSAESAPELTANRSVADELQKLLYSKRWMAAHQFQTLTDSDGTFQFDQLPNDIAFGVSAEREGYRLRSESPISGLFAPAQALFIGEQVYPLSIAIEDHQGRPVHEASIRWQPATFPPLLDPKRLPEAIEASAQRPPLLMAGAHHPALPRGWYLLQAFSNDGLAKSQVALVQHNPADRGNPERLILQQAGRVFVRLSPTNEGDPQLSGLSIRLAELPNHLDEESSLHAAEAIAFGAHDDGAAAQNFGRSKEIEFPSVGFGEHVLIASLEDQLVHSQHMVVEREVTIVELRLPDLPPLVLRTIAVTGVPTDALEAPEVFLEHKNYNLSERLRIIERSPGQIKVIEPSAATEWIPLPDEYILLTGRHRLYGVAQSKVELSPKSTWQLDFQSSTDILFHLAEGWESSTARIQLRYTLDYGSLDQRFRGSLVVNSRQHVIGSVPRGTAQLTIEAIIEGDQDEIPSGSIVVLEQPITLTADTCSLQVPWPDGHPLTSVHDSGNWPRFISFTRNPGGMSGAFNLRTRDLEGNTLSLPWFPAGEWNCLQSDRRARYFLVPVAEKPFHHYGPTVLHIDFPRIAAWRIASFDSDSPLARAGVQVGDEIVAYNGNHPEALWEAVKNPPEDRVYSQNQRKNSTKK